MNTALAGTVAADQRAAASGIRILCGGQELTEIGEAAARVTVQFQVVGHLAGIGLLAIGWVADPLGEIEHVLLGADDLPIVDIGAASPVLGRADAQAIFRVPPSLKLSFGFVAILPGAEADARAHVVLRLRSGTPLRKNLPTTGDPAEFAELVMRAPADYALALLAHAARSTPGIRPVPLVEHLAQYLYDRIDVSFDYGRGDGRVAVACHIDVAMRIANQGVLLKGWMLSGADDAVTDISVVSMLGTRATMSLPLPRLARLDVLESSIADGMSNDRHCGFVAYADTGELTLADRRWFINITMRGGTIRRIPFLCGATLPPIGAIQSIVSFAESSALDFNDLFRRAIAPALDRTWATLQTERAPAVVRDFGAPPEGAAVSVIVPLYGRMDFVRHQIASFSNDPDFHPDAGMVELIYVLDDPGAEKDLLVLCRLLFDIYGVPFRLVLQGGNYGYSAANNAGARAATGRKLLLLNSDVMPKQGRWVGAMARLYDSLDGCGVVGCRLLFEDGSIQHAGMSFRPSLFFADAWTNEHCFKGLSVAFDPHADTAEVVAVTGACLLIDRTLYHLVGGIAEDYVIGDFEDSDLCLKVHRRGLKVYYTPHVELYHLERQSMKRIGHGHEGWRQSLTLFNMWKHSQRWARLIVEVSARYDPDAVLPAAATATQAEDTPPVAAPAPAPAPTADLPDGHPRLARFEAIGQGSETSLLPQVAIPARTHFTVFPASADMLTPFRPEPFDIVVPRFSVFDFERVSLHGFRLFEVGEHLFNDQSLVDDGTESSTQFWRKVADGQTEQLTLNEAGLPQAAEAPIAFDGTDCLILSADEPANFGSWIYRYLAKFALARQARPCRRVFAYDDGRWMAPVLRLVDPEVEIVPQLPGRSYDISHASIASLPAPHVFFRPEIAACLREIADRIGKVADLPERLYISRRKQALLFPGLRVLENETELVEKLAMFGFVEFFPEDHPLEIQVAAFAQARLIVSPGGSNLFCAAFAQKADFILDIESSDNWSYAHMNLLASTQRPFSLVQGRLSGRGDAVHSNWRVDVNALIEGLQGLAVLGRS